MPERGKAEKVKGEVYFGGVPTGPFVAKLVQELGIPTPGIIEHSSVEAVIGEKRGTSRYRTITSAWRKEMAKIHNLEIRGEPRIGFRVLTEPERVDNAAWTLKKGVRTIRKGGRQASTVRVAQLDETSRRKHDAVTLAAAKMLGTVTATGKAMVDDFRAATAQLPRRAITKDRVEAD